MKFPAKNTIRIIVSVVLLYLIYSKIDIARFLTIVKGANLFFVFLAFVCINGNYFFSGFRWRSLIFYSDKFKGWGVFRLTKLYYKGAFFNNFFPSTIGGDIYKVYTLGKETGNVSGSLAATFMDRLTGLVVLAFISSFSLIVMMGFWGLLVFLLFWFLIFIGFISLFIFSKYSKKLNSFKNSLISYKDNKKSIVRAVFWSFGVQITANIAGYFAAKAVGLEMSLAFAFFSFPVIGFLSFIPVSFNGFGLQDFLYLSFFSRFSYSSEIILTASFLAHVTRVCSSLIGGLFLLQSSKKI